MQPEVYQAGTDVIRMIDTASIVFIVALLSVVLLFLILEWVRVFVGQGNANRTNKKAEVLENSGL